MAWSWARSPYRTTADLVEALRVMFAEVLRDLPEGTATIRETRHRPTLEGDADWACTISPSRPGCSPVEVIVMGPHRVSIRMGAYSHLTVDVLPWRWNALVPRIRRVVAAVVDGGLFEVYWERWGAPCNYRSYLRDERGRLQSLQGMESTVFGLTPLDLPRVQLSYEPYGPS